MFEPRTDSTWINTFTGRQFWPLNPRVEDIYIEDIAHALSLQCRWMGHTRVFYSVAEHCCHVANRVPAADRLWGLLHDASEAYLCDVARPVKHSATMRGYRHAEAQLMAAVCARFGLEPTQPESVTVADNRMLITEARALLTMHPDWLTTCTAEPYPSLLRAGGLGRASDAAEAMFLARFHELRTGGYPPT